MSNDQQKEYFAFISYKREDEKWAKWLQRKMEHYRFPLAVRKADISIPEYIRPVFKDTTDLNGSELSGALSEALDKSLYLIVICSRNTPRSAWVDKEAKSFIDSSNRHRIIPFVVDGVPYSEDPEKECLPASLKSLSGDRELLCVNINESGKEAAFVRVVSRMFGVKFDTLWRRYQRDKRRKKILWSALGTLLAIIICFFLITLWGKNMAIGNLESDRVSREALDLVENGDNYAAQQIIYDYVTKNKIKASDIPTNLEKALRKSVFSRSYILRGHTDAVTSAVLSHDESLIVSSSADSTVRIWDTRNGKCLKVLSGHDDLVRAALFSPDDTQILSYSNDWTVRLWNVETGQCEKIIDAGAIVYHAAFAPDGHSFATVDNEGTIRIWDIETGRSVDLMNNPKSGVAVDFSEKGDLLMCAFSDGTAMIMNVKDGDVLREIKMEGYLEDASFSPGGFVLASVSGLHDESLQLWSLIDEEKVAQTPIQSCHSCSFIPSQGMAAASSLRKVEIKAIEDDLNFRDITSLSPDNGEVRSISFSADGRFMVITGDVTIKVIDYLVEGGGEFLLDSRKNVAFLASACPPSDTVFVNSARFSKDGSLILSGGFEINTTGRPYTHNNVQLWDFATGQLLREYVGHLGGIQDVCFANASHLIASASRDSSVIIWDIEKTTPQLRLQSHSDVVESVIFSDDDKYLLSASRDGTIKVWEAQTGECVRTLCGHQDEVHSLKINPGNNLLLSSSNDGTVKIWDWKQGECLDTFKVGKEVNDAVFSNDGGKIAVVTDDGYAKIWDITSRKIEHSIRIGELASSVLFCLDDTNIVTASMRDSGYLQIWNLEDEKCLFSTPMIGFPQSIELSPDENYLLVGRWWFDDNILAYVFPSVQNIMKDIAERFDY